MANEELQLSVKSSWTLKEIKQARRAQGEPAGDVNKGITSDGSIGEKTSLAVGRFHCEEFPYHFF